MSTFFALYIIVYGGMNAYAFLKVRMAFSLGLRIGLPVALWFVFMVAAPILVRLLEHNGLDRLARILVWPAMGWFGFVFLFMVTAGMLDLLRLIARIAPWRALSHQELFFIALTFSLITFVYGVLEARAIRVERVSVDTHLLAQGQSVRIAQISDVHLGLTVGAETLERIIALVQKESPDMLVATGDIVDGLMEHDGRELSAKLQALTLPLGKFGVFGNHETYAGGDYAAQFFARSGITLLRDEAAAVRPDLYVLGIDYHGRDREGIAGEQRKLAVEIPQEAFALVLRHVPSVAVERPGMLQLSGHTHKGQIFPFSLVVRRVFPYIAGLYTVGPEEQYLYVSRGTGVWGPPIRVGAPPEVTLLTIHGTGRGPDIINESGETGETAQ